MNSPLQVPSDLNDLSNAQMVGQTRTGFITREEADAGAMPASAAQALTEHREPTDSKYLTTGLPSGCKLYTGFTDNVMHVRRFGVEDTLKIYDARAEESLRMLAEAVGATLDNFSVWDLTVGDFWFLMYWHRIHSYPKSPFIVNWTCGHTDHLTSINQGKLGVETLNQEMVLRNSDLQVVELKEEVVRTKLKAIADEYGVTADVMRMGDYVRIIEMEEEDELHLRKTAEETGKAVPKYRKSDYLMARHASNLGRVHGASIEDRVQALKNLNDTSMWKHLDELVLLADHGVVETYKVGCKACGHKAEVEVALDAMTFLPEL